VESKYIKFNSMMKSILCQVCSESMQKSIKSISVKIQKGMQLMK